MPLSEHEQRLLEQMERALYAEDPKFASALREPVIRTGSRKRLLLGVVVALAGLGVLIAGVAVKLPVVGVLGFIAMLAGVTLALTGGSTTEAGSTGAAAAPGAAGKANKRGASPAGGASGGFMGRMEDRWRHRQEGDPNS